MKILKIIFAMGIFMTVFTACEKKVLPVDSVEKPIFFTEGTIDGESLTLIAGPDDVIVNTNYVESSNNLPVFSTNFVSDGVANSEGLSFRIIGDEIINADLDFVDKLPLGPLEITSYEGVSNSDSFDLIIVANAGASYAIEGDLGEIPIVDNVVSNIEDGDYTLSLFSADPNCTYIYGYNFSILEGELCGHAPSLNIEDGFLSYSIPNGAPLNDYVININNVIYTFPPDVPVEVSTLLGGELALQTISIIESPISSCVSVSFWEFLAPPTTCNPFLILEIVEQPLSEFPLSASVEYIKDNGQVYRSISNPSSFIGILDVVPFYDDPFDREAYTVHIDAEIELENVQDASDVISLELQNAYIPMVNE